MLHQFLLPQTMGVNIHFPAISSTLDVTKHFHFSQSDKENKCAPNFIFIS